MGLKGGLSSDGRGLYDVRRKAVKPYEGASQKVRTHDSREKA